MPLCKDPGPGGSKKPTARGVSQELQEYVHPDDATDEVRDPEGETPFPDRPIFGTNLLVAFGIASAAEIVFDASPVDWTAANTRLTPVIDSDHGNEKIDGADSTPISVSGDDITLPSGTYRVDISMILKNANTSTRLVEVAITNVGGTTVHATKGIIVQSKPATGGTPQSMFNRTFILKFGAEAVINLRVAQSTGALTDTDVIGGHVMTVQRLGNAI